MGLGVNLFKELSHNQNYLEFNYKAQDSLFNAATGDPQISDSVANASEKKIASKAELLDFSKANKSKRKTEVAASSKIVNLNSASLQELLTLPGVGKKTAENIIGYRNKSGPLKKIADLLKVKGIGEAKIKKFEKYITIE